MTTLTIVNLNKRALTGPHRWLFWLLIFIPVFAILFALLAWRRKRRSKAKVIPVYPHQNVGAPMYPMHGPPPGGAHYYASGPSYGPVPPGAPGAPGAPGNYNYVPPPYSNGYEPQPQGDGKTSYAAPDGPPPVHTSR
ncbi:uncharacterized protein LODBEIA_P60360 [Lodderomyces beijingensis]|uniref:Uncharacterized protein n=1 Tax=Lodderomyces beijingensis TaxID=1775926 RepID=A0ABP0ZVV6_9ASCO